MVERERPRSAVIVEKQMIIDVHVHSSPGMGLKFLPLLREECRKNGVTLCLLSSIGVNSWSYFPSSKEVRAANDEASSLAANSGGLLRWYAYINPQNADWRKEMNRCAARGAIGIKLWVSLKDKIGSLVNTEKALRHAAFLRKPALVHAFNRTGESLPGEITLPEFMELARRHPQTRMIAAHSGIHWPSETGLFCRLPNVWLDICGGYPIKGQVEALVREMGADRILFGSDMLGRSQASQLAKVALADCSEAQKNKILYQNAALLFGLEDALKSRTAERPSEALGRDALALPSPKPAKCPVDATEDHFCFCGQWPFFKTDYQTPYALNTALVKHGIKRACTADLGGIYRQDLETANAVFLKDVRKFGIFKPLAIINPRIPNWRPTLEKTSPKFAGIILFPFLHAWSLADRRYIHLFRWCRRHKIKLWINCQLDDARLRHASAISRDVSTEDLLGYGALPDTPETVFQGVSGDIMETFLKRHAGNKRFRFEISRLTDTTGALSVILNKYGSKNLVMGSECPFRDIRAVRWVSQRV